jgi:hypothetical protein
MCPVRALGEWIVICNFTQGHLFRRIMSGDRVDTSDRPIVRTVFPNINSSDR